MSEIDLIRQKEEQAKALEGSPDFSVQISEKGEGGIRIKPQDIASNTEVQTTADLVALNKAVGGSVSPEKQHTQVSGETKSGLAVSTIEEALNGGDLPSDKAKFLEEVLNMADSGK